MQKIATRIFIYASIVFGFFGILFVLSLPGAHQQQSSDIAIIFQKIVMASVFVILPSFALSVAGKYLSK